MPVPATTSTAAPPVVNTTLAEYVPSAEKPWDLRRVTHLYRRLAFGCSLAQAQAGLQLTPAALVDQLLDTAANLGSPDPPYWSGYTTADYNLDPDPAALIAQHLDELSNRWVGEMLSEGVRAKMALFWHNHFVTELNDVVCNSYLWEYYKLLNLYAFGNFRVFAREMGKSAAMLVYLNGNQNIASQPNENYARELLELFTLGENNGYTQIDIVEMARALTGWRAPRSACTPAFFNSGLFSNTNKTIFGQTANFNFDQAHNLVFSERPLQASRYIATKIYRNYVYQTPDPQIIDQLAQTLRDNNWELLPMLKQLFKSELFFEDFFRNARIKSPIETLLSIFQAAGARYPDHLTATQVDNVRYWIFVLGQDLFNPPNVAGWPGYRAWINESTLTTRWTYSASCITYVRGYDETKENLRNLAINLTANSNVPEVIVPALIDFILGQTLDATQESAAVQAFKDGIPENYFDDGSWNLGWDEAPLQIANMLYYLVKLPEFQLT